MSTPSDVGMVNEAAKRAQKEILDLLTALVPLNVGAQGQSYGTHTASREDRILAFMEDARSGALDIYQTVNPDAAREYVRQFVRDTMASPVMRSGPAGRLATTVAGMW